VAALYELRELMASLWDLMMEDPLLRKNVPSPGSGGGGSSATSAFASAADQYGFGTQVLSSTQYRN